MSFSSLFFTADAEKEAAEKAAKKQTETTAMPITAPAKVTAFPSTAQATSQATVFPSAPTPSESFPTSSPTVSPNENRFLNDIIAGYDTNFNKLNQPGYDFFEFFKAVNAGGVDNPQVYVMALQMAQSMDGTVTKDSLINQSDYYIAELEKVHTAVKDNGSQKANELNEVKNTETKTLATDIESIKLQIENLTTQLQTKQQTLTEIDSKYQPKLSEIAEKLQANDIARDGIISNINKVRGNIQNNLK